MAWILLLKRVVSWFVTSLFVSAILINIANVIGRYVFMSPLYWAEEVMVILFTWCVFLGAALVAVNDEHLKSGAMQSLLKGRARAIHAKVVHALVFVVLAYVAYLSTDIVAMMFRMDQKTVVAEVPKSIVYASMMVGLTATALVNLFQFIRFGRAPSGGATSVEDASTRPP